MPQSLPWFTVLFLLALGVSLAMQLWLARRQVQHVAANRAAPPAHFATRITLAAHQKADAAATLHLTLVDDARRYGAVPTGAEAEQLARDLGCFLGAGAVELFPAWDFPALPRS